MHEFLRGSKPSSSHFCQISLTGADSKATSYRRRNINGYPSEEIGCAFGGDGMETFNV